MSEDKLSLAKRELTGKKVKGLREQGLIPSVVFGDGELVLTQSAYNETEKVLLSAGYHSPIDLDIAGKKQMALVKVVHLDPVKRTIMNVEFQAISANQVVEATAPIEIVNFEKSDASKAHLAILQVMEEIDVKAKPADLPESIEVDASGLKTAEDGIVVADLKLPKGVELADKVTVQLMATDPYLSPRKQLVKSSEKNGLYLAMDIADIWLERALANKV